MGSNGVIWGHLASNWPEWLTGQVAAGSFCWWDILPTLARVNPPSYAARMKWRRSLIIAFGLTAYWILVGNEIVIARASDGVKGMEWFTPWLLTIPWSIFFNLLPDSLADRIALQTGITVSGAILNGFIFVGLVCWLDRGPRPDVIDDYKDGASETTRDGRVDP